MDRPGVPFRICQRRQRTAGAVKQVKPVPLAGGIPQAVAPEGQLFKHLGSWSLVLLQRPVSFLAGQPLQVWVVPVIPGGDQKTAVVQLSQGGGGHRQGEGLDRLSPTGVDLIVNRALFTPLDGGLVRLFPEGGEQKGALGGPAVALGVSLSGKPADGAAAGLI